MAAGHACWATSSRIRKIPILYDAEPFGCTIALPRYAHQTCEQSAEKHHGMTPKIKGEALYETRDWLLVA